MTRADWDPELNTGNAFVDEQHMKLFEMFNELHDAAEEGHGQATVESILDRLSEYIMVHFEAERLLMIESGFDPAMTAEHLGQHDDLTQRTRDMIQRYRLGEATMAGPLALFLSDWLLGHIRETDRALVAHVRSAR